MVFILYTLMCFIFGTTFLLIKTGISLGWSPFLFSSLRFILAGGILLVLFRKKRRVPLKLNLKIFFCSLLMTTIPFGVLYYGEQFINSGESAILVITSPIFILILGRRFHLRQLMGAFLCIAGVILIVVKDFSHTTQTHAAVAKGLMILGEIAFAWGTIQSKRILEEMEDTSVFNSLQMFYGGMGLLLFALLKGEKFSLPTEISGFLILFYFVIVASIIANGIFFALIKKTNAFFPATWTYVSPLIAMIMGWLVLKEQFGVKGIAGAFFVLIGVLLANSGIIEEWMKQKRKANLDV